VTAAVGFLAASIESPEWFEEWDSSRNPDLWLYRRRTAAILRRYFQMSVEVGRLPSILGKEFFRSKVTSYNMSSFEDAVIFVHDVEKCLGKLDGMAQGLLARVILQGFSQDEAARLFGYCRRTVERKVPEALDQLSEILLAAGILEALEGPREEEDNACQEGEEEENLVTM
jgi:DNA-directed RNA polymerase specialized sigma24 family protein